MREIKFRGKRLDNGEWVYGFYLQIWVGTRFKYIIHKEYDEFEVAQETLGQYIGLKDKNGKEIYEGDIISDGYDKAVISWEKCANIGCNGGEYSFDITGFVPKIKRNGNLYVDSSGKCEWLYGELINEGCEVIGNKYDNLELICEEDTE